MLLKSLNSSLPCTWKLSRANALQIWAETIKKKKKEEEIQDNEIFVSAIIIFVFIYAQMSKYKAILSNLVQWPELDTPAHTKPTLQNQGQVSQSQHSPCNLQTAEVTWTENQKRKHLKENQTKSSLSIFHTNIPSHKKGKHLTNLYPTIPLGKSRSWGVRGGVLLREWGQLETEEGRMGWGTHLPSRTPVNYFHRLMDRV